jgi:2,3-bisphosphoglycerate-independent phosphoglycerate mutase
MKPPGYGEVYPRLDDDRLPVVLVVLDGLGDRPSPDLGHRTPAEAAHTPVLDRLVRRGASGWHIPFGWGRAPASELAHWSMFGFGDVPFPGRAVLEAIGAGVDVPSGVAVTFGALRTSQVLDGRAWVTGRPATDDTADADHLLRTLVPILDGYGVRVHPVGAGEAILLLTRHRRADVTDSDPFFEELHPWLRVRPIQAAAPDADTTDPDRNRPDPARPIRARPDAAAAAVADEINALLLEARRVLVNSPVNEDRRRRGKPALDLLTTKWSGVRQPLPCFAEHTGVAGGAVTDSRLYRGLASLLGMAQIHIAPGDNLADDMAGRLDAAWGLIAGGARFVHVHTKVTDEAGHAKQPGTKRDVLEALDPGLAALEALVDGAIVAVTGDHATPSVNGVLHTGDPTPLVIAGPTVRADRVTGFGEWSARDGWFGPIRSRELLPLLFSHANRPIFLGHRATPHSTLALPDEPDAMPLA